MKTPADAYSSPSRFQLIIALLIITLFGALIYFAAVPNHPPGFYIDESSIAYNAHLIAQTGTDEHGQRWPLYFRAFGDYKNPTYVYLLAALYKITGPSITVARLLSAALGLLNAVLLGLLAWRLTGKIIVVVVIAVSALFTPWFYENSRLVFEVSLYPVLCMLFLLALRRASQKHAWQIGDVLGLSATLALLTYSYSIGRLLGPLLAVGLAFFIKRHGWRSVIKVWVGYAVTLIPLFVFQRNHPGALSDRFALLTYITPDSKPSDVAFEFVRHYFANLTPWRWLITGENNVRDHLSGFGSLLAVTVIVGLAGAFIVLRKHLREPWWQFILYGSLVSVIPASLTRNEFPQLRLIAFPVFFHVLMAPALSWLLKVDNEAAAGLNASRLNTRARTVFWRRAILLVAISLIVIQGAYFQWRFHTTANDRWYVFDARFPRKVFATALETEQSPIYVFDPPGKSGYIQAYWYAVLQGVDTSRLVHLPSYVAPPPGALVISTEEECGNCKLIAKSINYTVYAVLPSALNVTIRPLPQNAFRAHIQAENPPLTLTAGTKSILNVLVKNLSSVSWPAVGAEGTNRYAVGLRNRWLRLDGSVLNDEDGRSRFPYDLERGDTAGVPLEITAPQIPGRYVLELDVVQEEFVWFGDEGSQRLTWQVVVEPPTRGVQ
ncbi:MAG TPA: glycosyltransferase family 39 protein [Pyrinomonadaceae bacterium]|nr:glycosyltransferase family 39 protein [Pyrinomonadaceae bacterium]